MFMHHGQSCLLNSCSRPDRTFHKLQASESGDQRFIKIPKLTICEALIFFCEMFGRVLVLTKITKRRSALPLALPMTSTNIKFRSLSIQCNYDNGSCIYVWEYFINTVLTKWQYLCPEIGILWSIHNPENFNKEALLKNK